ncbi:MAG: fructose-1,6-bisphosphatase [Streptococcaceae bacterium]|jgi:fructose-1,6-bisphosphatase-3|nr:fructose-1,6-bisphosphatase [Streptococcaceae bacterium]
MSNEEKVRRLLREKFPSKAAIYSELINLETIQNLPKGTEIYLSDIHGSYEALAHILRTGSGNVKEKIINRFGTEWTEAEIDLFTLLVSYPEYALSKKGGLFVKSRIWYFDTLEKLLELTKYCATKYSRSKLRKALPTEFTYIIEECLYADVQFSNKMNYRNQILNKLIDLRQAEAFIIGLSKTIQRLIVDHLHIVGDIYDRGRQADKVMDILMAFHSVDIQWGNHDLLWMGAMFGSAANLATLLRIAARYHYLFDLEAAYGLNLRPLFLFADKVYPRHCEFRPKYDSSDDVQEENIELLEKVHQALAIMQFKLEGQIIKRHPEYQMNDRLLLEMIDYQQQLIHLEGKSYPLDSYHFPTINPDSPYELTLEEEKVLSALLDSFKASERLQREIQFLLDKGSMYQIYNGQLLFHGCIPLDKNGEFAEFVMDNVSYHGRALLDKFEATIRQIAKNATTNDLAAADFLWYCWSGRMSPLFGKSRMTTFERYYIKDKATQIEENNPYFDLRDNEAVCLKILQEFGLTNSDAKIINGHTPVRVIKGEHPVKANGRLIVIDGGMSTAYQQSTGIAGYSLVYNSNGFMIVTHQPFHSVAHIFQAGKDLTHIKNIVDQVQKRLMIRDTTIGLEIKEQIDDLTALLE